MYSYSLLNDFELINLLKAGQEAAFRVIYDRHWQRLYTIAYHRLNDSPEAEEIVQDIFCNFWRKRDTIELTKGLDHYFAVAVKFEVINHLVRRARTV